MSASLGRFTWRLRALVGEGLHEHEPLSRHTTMRVGGPARFWVDPPAQVEVGAITQLAAAHGVPLLVLGAGSNLLPSDAGFDGLVLHLGQLRDCHVEGQELTAGAGVTLTRLIRCGMRHGLAGLEALTGVPASVGGAVAMNAGSGGVEVGDRLIRARLLLPDGRIEERPGHRLRFGYRRAELAGAIVLAATFRLDCDAPAAIRARIKQYLKVKRSSQPLSWPSAGCIFRNPPGDSAGRLIDGAGLKGLRVGGAEISTRHANFIINRDEASAGDVLALIDIARQVVKERFGVELQQEVRVQPQGLLQESA